ncbi:hypothetical protein WK29_01880 [Burkholderia vietnamiensis]|nr:hypothetical protein WK29_01880 [Burkholderia vietnamiensis]
MVVPAVAMAVVHEEVHQRAGCEQQERQEPDHVGGVFLEQEVARDRAENEQTDPVAGAPETWGRFVVTVMLVHDEASFQRVGVTGADYACRNQ